MFLKVKEDAAIFLKSEERDLSWASGVLDNSKGRREKLESRRKKSWSQVYIKFMKVDLLMCYKKLQEITGQFKGNGRRKSCSISLEIRMLRYNIEQSKLEDYLSSNRMYYEINYNINR
ncbi:hypothetical protein ACTXT7_001270 [Hymenolepis weldensis]